jgi:hypothetical protein
MNAPAFIIQTAISTTKSFISLCNGDINIHEFFTEIGRNGTTLLASAQGAIIGQALIPIPVVGALIGGLASTLISGAIYDYTIGMKMLSAEIDEFSNQLSKERTRLKEYHARLLELNIDKFKADTKIYNLVADLLSNNYSDKDFNTLLKVTYECLEIPCPWGSGTLDAFMQDKTRVLTFG